MSGHIGGSPAKQRSSKHRPCFLQVHLMKLLLVWKSFALKSSVLVFILSPEVELELTPSWWGNALPHMLFTLKLIFHVWPSEFGPSFSRTQLNLRRRGKVSNQTRCSVEDQPASTGRRVCVQMFMKVKLCVICVWTTKDMITSEDLDLRTTKDLVLSENWLVRDTDTDLQSDVVVDETDSHS